MGSGSVEITKASALLGLHAGIEASDLVTALRVGAGDVDQLEELAA